MNFYQAMQLDVSVCKGKIRNAAIQSERHKLIAGLDCEGYPLCSLCSRFYFYSKLSVWR